MLRIVFMGSPTEVTAPLAHLAEVGPELGFELVAVISQPARPVGRSSQVMDPPVAAWAKAQKYQCLQPESAKDAGFLAELRLLNPDIIVTAAYGQILSDEFLKIPRVATINIHPSRLPAHRGATPVPATLLDQLKTATVTVLFTVKKLDSGNIILTKDFAIGPEETAGELTARLFFESGPMLIDALSILDKDHSFAGVPQDHAAATFCKKIEKDDGRIQWALSSEEISARFRAFEPWPGSWTWFQGKRITVTSLKIVSSNTHNQPPGALSWDKPTKALHVTTSTGTVAIRSLKPAGGKNIDAAAFWNGLKQREHLFFTTEEMPS